MLALQLIVRTEDCLIRCLLSAVGPRRLQLRFIVIRIVMPDGTEGLLHAGEWRDSHTLHAKLPP
jgi:hypothetical protein